jgi:hypothetical protein
MGVHNVHNVMDENGNSSIYLYPGVFAVKNGSASYICENNYAFFIKYH